MKIRNLLIGCLIIILSGGALMAGGFAAGGQLYASYYSGTIHPVSETWSDATGVIENAVSDHVWSTGNSSGRSNTAVAPGAEGDASTVLALDFELGAGNFTIQTGDTFSVSGGRLNDNKIRDGVWTLDILGMASSDAVVITLPKDTAFSSVSIELGGGNLLCSVPLAADKIDLEVGAGSLESDLLTANELSISVGAGRLSGTLAGSLDDYIYTAECGLGSIIVNDTALVSGIGSSQNNSGGARVLDLEAGMGAIQLFTED